MSYTVAKVHDLEGNETFVNEAGEHQCVEFVRQATGAPHTTLWNRGIKVMDAAPGSIPPKTAIATFDENKKYPPTERHAAIYMSHINTGNNQGITVYD